MGTPGGVQGNAWTPPHLPPPRSLLSQLQALQALIKQTSNKAAQTSTCVLVPTHIPPHHQKRGSAPPGGQHTHGCPPPAHLPVL